jgi:chemotaxis protein histidine kinase CheA
MSLETDDEFQKELIEVFVQEAQEWLQQIHVALDELQQGPAPDRHLQLTQTIKTGIANMAGTAATINLTEVERASFAVLPFVEAVQDPTVPASAGDFIALCKRLGDIHTALTQATGVTFDAESAVASVAHEAVTVPAQELLLTLNGLQEQQARSGSPRRNLVQAVIAQVKGLIDSGVGQCNVTTLREFLGRWSEREDGFLQSVQQQHPDLIDELKRLTCGEGGQGSASERLQLVVEQVAQLWSAAQQVNASQATTFFMGLHSFLTVAMQQRIVVEPKKYEAVGKRLEDVLKAIQVWVEVGRAERAAIGAALPG